MKAATVVASADDVAVDLGAGVGAEEDSAAEVEAGDTVLTVHHTLSAEVEDTEVGSGKSVVEMIDGTLTATSQEDVAAVGVPPLTGAVIAGMLVHIVKLDGAAMKTTMIKAGMIMIKEEVMMMNGMVMEMQVTTKAGMLMVTIEVARDTSPSSVLKTIDVCNVKDGQSTFLWFFLCTYLLL